MARKVLTSDVTIAASGYTQPERKLKKGQVVELSAAEITAIGAGNLRDTVARDQLGEHVGVTNSS
jgi:hypothetical protein